MLPPSLWGFVVILHWLIDWLIWSTVGKIAPGEWFPDGLKKRPNTAGQYSTVSRLDTSSILLRLSNLSKLFSFVDVAHQPVTHNHRKVRHDMGSFSWNDEELLDHLTITEGLQLTRPWRYLNIITVFTVVGGHASSRPAASVRTHCSTWRNRWSNTTDSRYGVYFFIVRFFILLSAHAMAFDTSCLPPSLSPSLSLSPSPLSLSLASFSPCYSQNRLTVGLQSRATTNPRRRVLVETSRWPSRSVSLATSLSVNQPSRTFTTG